MEWMTKYTLGAALVAAALVLPLEAQAQTQPGLLAAGVGSTTAQRVGAPSVVQSGVNLAPGAGINEFATPATSYETSNWRPLVSESAEAATEPDLVALQRQVDENQNRARNRHTTRPINVPATLGMLKDNPTPSRPRNVAPNARLQPQYLQYSPNMQTSQSAYLRQQNAPQNPATATSGAPTLNWDGSTNRTAQFGTTRPAQFVNAAAQQALDQEFPDAAPYQVPGVTPFPNIEDVDDGSTFSDDVLSEIQDATNSLGAPLSDDATPVDSDLLGADAVEQPLDSGAIAPESNLPAVVDDAANAVDASAAQIDPNGPTFTQPVFDEPAIDDADAVNPQTDPSLDLPDFNDPGDLTQSPESVDVPDAVAPEAQPVEPADVELAPSPEPAATEPAAQPAAAPTAVPAPVVAQPAQPAPATTPFYGPAPAAYPGVVAPRPGYRSVAPYVSTPTPYAPYAPQAQRLPQTRGVPGQDAWHARAGQGTFTSQIQEYPASEQYYGSGLNLSSYDSGAWRPGLVGGAEWFYWTTDSDASYATIVSGNSVSGRDLKVENSGLRGRVGVRSANGWDMIGVFTWFNQSDSASLAAASLASGETLGNVRLGDDLADVQSRLKVNLQAIDIEMGRWTTVGAWNFRFFGGVRWTGLNQDYLDAGSTLTANAGTGAGDGLLDGEIAVLDSAALNDEFLESDAALGAAATAASPLAATGATQLASTTRSRLNAYGVRLGIETRVPLMGNLAIYGKGAGALAAGRVKSTFYDAALAPQDEFKKNYLTPSVDASLGLSWNLNGLEAHVGYEFNAWYNSGYVAGNKTDFLAHGVVAGTGWNF